MSAARHKPAVPFPADTFTRMESDPRWGGWGYLGERSRTLMVTDDAEYEAAWPHVERVAAVERTDAAVLVAASERRWTVEQLFQWADSTLGRHFADAAFNGQIDRSRRVGPAPGPTMTADEPAAVDVERLCVVMHDAYEAAAVQAGWETQARSRKPWADVPEANKATMRAAVTALLDALPALGYVSTRQAAREVADAERGAWKDGYEAAQDAERQS
jgi:hypothetical protein